MGLKMVDNDINIKVINTSKFKTICIAILLRQSLQREHTTYNAILPKLLMMGCKKYKTIKDINIKIEEMSGAYIHSDILKKGDNQIIEFLVEFVEDKVKLDEVFEFLNEIILNPLVDEGGFNNEYFEKAKELTKEDINARENDKIKFAKDRCIELMCENEKFGILADGYIEDLEQNKIDRFKLYNHYNNILKTSEIDIMAIGNIKEDDMKNMTNKYFNIDNRHYEPIKSEFYFKEKCEAKSIVEKFNITQGKLCMAFRTNIKPDSNDFIGLLVGNEILGGGSGSLLFNNVREKENLCYYINSFIYMFKGIVFVQSGVDFKNYEKTIQHIKDNVENIKNGEFNDSNLQLAINSLCKKYNSILDYNTSTIDYHYTNYLANVNFTIQEIIEKIKSVKKEHIKEAFKDIWLDTCYFMKGDEN